jgi:hypothetical protein
VNLRDDALLARIAEQVAAALGSPVADERIGALFARRPPGSRRL